MPVGRDLNPTSGYKVWGLETTKMSPLPLLEVFATRTGLRNNLNGTVEKAASGVSQR